MELGSRRGPRRHGAQPVPDHAVRLTQLGGHVARAHAVGVPGVIHAQRVCDEHVPAPRGGQQARQVRRHAVVHGVQVPDVEAGKGVRLGQPVREKARPGRVPHKSLCRGRKAVPWKW